MTISKKPPGTWHVTCDECGDCEELFTDPDDSIVEAVADVKAIGWRILPPDMIDRGRYTTSKWKHHCAVCTS